MQVKMLEITKTKIMLIIYYIKGNTLTDQLMFLFSYKAQTFFLKYYLRYIEYLLNKELLKDFVKTRIW